MVARATARPRRGLRLPFAALMTFTFILIIAPQTFFPVLALVPHRVCRRVRGHRRACRPAGSCRRQPLTRPHARDVRRPRASWLGPSSTVPFSYWPGGSVSFLTSIYFKTLAVFWLLGNVVNTLPRLRAIAWGLALMSAPLAPHRDQQLPVWRVRGGTPASRRRSTGSRGTTRRWPKTPTTWRCCSI